MRVHGEDSGRVRGDSVTMGGGEGHRARARGHFLRALLPCPPVDYLFLLPPAVGTVRARARGELIEASLSAAAGHPVRVEVAADYAELLARGLSDEVHLVWAPAMACVELEKASRALFKTVRHGRASYRSVLVCRREWEGDLDDLAGTRAAWVDRLSLGGYLLAAELLRRRGLSLEATFADQRFLGSHPAALAAVMEGEADVTAVSVGDRTPDEIVEALALHAGPQGPERLRALAVSDPAPSDALVVTGALPEPEAARLIQRLFPGGGGGRGPASLCLAMEAEGFQKAAPGEYAPLARLLDRG